MYISAGYFLPNRLNKMLPVTLDLKLLFFYLHFITPNLKTFPFSSFRRLISLMHIRKFYNVCYFSQLICFSLTSYLSSETDKGIIKIVLNIARNIHYQKLIKIMLNSNNRSHYAVYLFWFEIGQNSCMLIIFSGNFNIKHDIQTKVKYISMLWIKYRQNLIIDQIVNFFFHYW